jgi:hypothetical protein
VVARCFFLTYWADQNFWPLLLKTEVMQLLQGHCLSTISPLTSGSHIGPPDLGDIPTFPIEPELYPKSSGGKIIWKNNIDRRLLLVQGKLIILPTYYYIKRFNYIFYTHIYIYLHTAKRSFNHSERLNTSANLRDLTYNMFLYW